MPPLCPTCGSPTSGAPFCPACGSSLTRPPRPVAAGAPPAPQPRPPLPPDGPALEVTEAELLREPARYRGRRVVVTGTWTCGFEASDFAGAWLQPPALAECSNGPASRRAVRVTGIWRHAPDGRFGHRGNYRAVLEAERIEPA